MRTVRWTLVVGALCAASACAPAITGSASDITKLEQDRAAHPTSASAARSLGIAYFRANRYSKARSTLAGATRLDPKDGVAALYLGMTAEAQNDLPAARRAYETYLAVGKTRGVKDQITTRLVALTRRENDAAARQAIAQERQLSTTASPVTTIAVLPFTFSGGDTSLKPLERGLADLVTTDLSRISALRVLDRGHLQAVLSELQLQQSGAIQAGTGVRVGHLLQAGSIVGGSISQLPNTRLNAIATVTSVQSSAPIGPGATDQQPVDGVFTLEKNIVLKLLDNLRIVPTTAERNAIEQRPTRSLAAFLAYSQGLGEEDAGLFDRARQSYARAERLDAQYAAAKRKRQEMDDLIAGNAVTAQTLEVALVRGGEISAPLQGARDTTRVALSRADSLRIVDTVGGPRITVKPARSGLSSLGFTFLNGLNPSPNAVATSSTLGTPQGAPAGTGGDNPTALKGTMTVTVKVP
jgi:TolB-like protein